MFFSVAAADELQRHVESFAGVVPTFDSAAAVEVGRDADVIDADQIYGVIDVIDKVLNCGWRVAGLPVGLPLSSLIETELLFQLSRFYGLDLFAAGIEKFH